MAEIAEGTALRGTGLDTGGIVSLFDPVNREIALYHDPFGEILLGLQAQKAFLSSEYLHSKSLSL